jgi:hypothetical protein
MSTADESGAAPLPPGTEVRTQRGEERVRTVRALEEQLDALQRLEDDDGFVVVTRPDGEFLQLRRLVIERGDGRGAVRRASMPPAIARVFVEFARREPGWEAGVEWIEPEEPTGMGRHVPGWVVAAALLACVAAIVGVVLLSI